MFLTLFPRLIILAIALKMSNCQETFESRWMERLYPVIKNQTILDLSIPGSHDTLTSDSSARIADNSNSLDPKVSWLLHLIGPFMEIFSLGSWIRAQAMTQGLKITEQLDSGIRFLDFRLAFTAGPKNLMNYDWYSVHMVQTNKKAIDYLTEIKLWLNNHDKEVVVIWFSNHGCEDCQTGTYHAEPKEMQKFWKQIENLLGPLLFDHGKRNLNETTLEEIIQLNSRVIIYAGEYSNFTNNSPLALPSNKIINIPTGEQHNFSLGIQEASQTFALSNDVINVSKSSNEFYLVHMAGDAGDQIWLSTKIKYFWPFVNLRQIKETCAELYNVPNMTEYCPMTLQANSLLKNYYHQTAFELAVKYKWGLPNAIYLDAIDYNGTFRVGPEEFGYGLPKSERIHGNARYSYTATFALINLYRVCPSKRSSEDCRKLYEIIEERRALYPIIHWKDEFYGRHDSWPEELLINEP
jgi:hypothetical protein